jgi:malate permease and related proteins
MIERIVSIIVPIFIVILVGFLYGRRHAPDMEAANRFNMDLFAPFLILSVFASQPLILKDYLPIALGGALVTLLPGLTAFIFAKIMGYQWKTFVPPMMFRNSGNMGLPLFLFAFGEALLPVAIILLIVVNMLHFTLGLLLINPRTHLLKVLRNPIIMASIAGLFIAATGLVLPLWLLRPLQLLGSIAVPLMLFSLGVRLVQLDIKGWRFGLIGALASPALGLMVSWPLALMLPLPPEQQTILILFGALPPAIINFLVAERYHQEPDKVAAIVMFSNAASLITIPLVLLLVL